MTLLKAANNTYYFLLETDKYIHSLGVEWISNLNVFHEKINLKIFRYTHSSFWCQLLESLLEIFNGRLHMFSEERKKKLKAIINTWWCRNYKIYDNKGKNRSTEPVYSACINIITSRRRLIIQLTTIRSLRYILFTLNYLI